KGPRPRARRALFLSSRPTPLSFLEPKTSLSAPSSYFFLKKHPSLAAQKPKVLPIYVLCVAINIATLKTNDKHIPENRYQGVSLYADSKPSLFCSVWGRGDNTHGGRVNDPLQTTSA
ncbi:hypothetical protein AVEN_179980-1, partial [Araneus ventricosus]